MKLAALLHVADVKRDRFHNYARLGNLPFSVDSGAGQLGDELRKHNDYSLDDAFRLRLFTDLIGGEGSDVIHSGLQPSYAAGLVQNSGVPHVNEIVLGSTDLWVGVCIEQNELQEGDPDWFLRTSSYFAGRLIDYPIWIAARDGDPVRSFIANATRAARDVRQRALELGLPEAEEFEVSS